MKQAVSAVNTFSTENSWSIAELSVNNLLKQEVWSDVLLLLLLTGVNVWRRKMLLKSSSAAVKEVCVTTSSSTVLTATSRPYRVRHLFTFLPVHLLDNLILTPPGTPTENIFTVSFLIGATIEQFIYRPLMPSCDDMMLITPDILKEKTLTTCED